MDDLMDCTNLKANMVLIHAVCVWSKAPTHCLFCGQRFLFGYTNAHRDLGGSTCISASESGISWCATVMSYGHDALWGQRGALWDVGGLGVALAPAMRGAEATGPAEAQG